MNVIGRESPLLTSRISWPRNVLYHLYMCGSIYIHMQWRSQGEWGPSPTLILKLPFIYKIFFKKITIYILYCLLLLNANEQISVVEWQIYPKLGHSFESQQQIAFVFFLFLSFFAFSFFFLFLKRQNPKQSSFLFF